MLWTNGGAESRFTFTGADIITLALGGNDYNNQWPVMSLSVNGQVIDSQTITSPNYGLDTYQFLALGVQGSQTLRVSFNNDGGESGAQGEPGTDIDLYIGDVTVAPAKLKSGDSSDTKKDLIDILQANANEDGYVLDPYEFASLISFILTGSIPDEQLLGAAESGALNTHAGLQVEIQRLLSSDKVENHMKYFVSRWFNAEEVLDNTELEEDIAHDMIVELQEFFWHVASNQDVPFSEFYSADYSFLNKRLADHYEVSSATNSNNNYVKTPFNGERGGIPTLGVFLANRAHGDGSAPILRGVEVREDMLCHHIGPPPTLEESGDERKKKEEDAQEAMESGTLTTREFYHIGTDSQACGSCHYEDINPLGFALENFDGLGRLRDQQIAVGTENDGSPKWIDVDAEGALWDPEQHQFTNHVEKIDVDGGRELALALAETQSVQSCLVEMAFRLAVNRPLNTRARDLWDETTDRELSALEAENFACAKERLEQSLTSNNQDVLGVFEAIANLELLRFRR